MLYIYFGGLLYAPELSQPGHIARARGISCQAAVNLSRRLAVFIMQGLRGG